MELHIGNDTAGTPAARGMNFASFLCHGLTNIWQAIDTWVFETVEFRDALLSDEDWKFLKFVSESLEVCFFEIF